MLISLRRGRIESVSDVRFELASEGRSMSGDQLRKSSFTKMLHFFDGATLRTQEA